MRWRGYDRPFTGKQGSVALSTGVVPCHARQHWRCSDYHRHRGAGYVPQLGRRVLDWLDAGRSSGPRLDSVFRLINEESRQPVESPTIRASREGLVIGLANHTLLIAKDGTERSIDDSAAPIRNDKGEVAGVVLVFRDISERRRQEQQVQDALTYADNIIATMREPFVVLDQSLRVKTANRSFYRNFHVSPEETEGRFICDLGSGQWNIPRLRTLLEGVLSNNHPIHDFDVEHDFPSLGKKIMLLNARRFESVDSQPNLILLAIEDITERRQAEVTVKTSEVRYRRLFQTAKDGILILDTNTGKIIDANPFMSGLLGYEHDEFLGKELWQIGVFGDIEASRAAYQELREHGYIRYEQPAYRLRVLVVDDNVDTAESMEMLLRMSGHDVRTAHTALNALEAAEAFQPNVVLLDIGLPVINGYEVARRLRRHSQFKNVRLVAMTGYGQKSDIQLSKEAGFDSHMVKPVDPKKIQELLTAMTPQQEPRSSIR